MLNNLTIDQLIALAAQPSSVSIAMVAKKELFARGLDMTADGEWVVTW